METPVSIDPPDGIGAATSTDLPGISDLLRAARLPLDGVDACLADAVVARAKGRVVGCAALELYGESALLRSVVVSDAVRGTGVGTGLVEAALALARARGARDVYLLTETAAPFFERLGFAPTARDDVPARVRTSVEFTSACPASAAVMHRALFA